MMQLPDSEWRGNAGLKSILAALLVDGKAPFAVGGAVRDSLLGLPVNDVDLATPLLPVDVIARLEDAGIKAVPTGLDHGTVTAVSDGKNYEITTYRRDVATDGRRATVTFSDDWREDAQRRDFTINALYADIESGKIHDCVGGLDDLTGPVIRFIGNADERIAEDHLRILRYFRFLARFGQQTADAEALVACASAANSLKSLSRERIASELTQMLALPDPTFAVSIMDENHIFDTFLPEIVSDAGRRIAEIVRRELEYSVDVSMPARLLTLLPAKSETVTEVVRRLKLSNRLHRNLLARIPQEVPCPGNTRALAFYNGVIAARDSVMLFAAQDQLKESLAKLENWDVPRFNLKGGELIRMGLEAGPIVATTLRQIEAQWIAEEFPDDKRLQEIACQFVSESS